MDGETLADVAKEIEKETGIAIPEFNMPEGMQ